MHRSILHSGTAPHAAGGLFYFSPLLLRPPESAMGWTYSNETGLDWPNHIKSSSISFSDKEEQRSEARGGRRTEKLKEARRSEERIRNCEGRSETAEETAAGMSFPVAFILWAHSITVVQQNWKDGRVCVGAWTHTHINTEGRSYFHYFLGHLKVMFYQLQTHTYKYTQLFVSGYFTLIFLVFPETIFTAN